MKSYVPGTADERLAMLETLGFDSMAQLFADIPDDLKFKGRPDVGSGMSEIELRRAMKSLAGDCRMDMSCFRGAGAYSRYIPSVVPQLAMRSEFYTAYTPYQPEMSQGMLQAIFEYQSMICRLTGMDASNASVYDGCTAASEAMIMAVNAKRKAKLAYSEALHPYVIETVKTYARFAKVELVPVKTGDDGLVDREALKTSLDGCAGFIAAQPNFFGCLDDMQALTDITHEAGALMIAYVDPISLGLIKKPGEYGADIAIGEGQQMGMPLAFGGPYMGFMAATAKLTRNLPGRITGQTEDAEGNRAFVLTLQAREQHIRREKASSNICSNQMLCAVMATIYLSVMGKKGIQDVEYQAMQKAHYLKDGLMTVKGIRMRYPDTPFINEFVIDTDKDASVINAGLKARGIMGGLRLNRLIEGDTGMLWCATEMNDRAEIDACISAMEEVSI